MMDIAHRPADSSRADEAQANNVDRRGFRPNVGIVVQNRLGQVLWLRRVDGFDAWQFPQGGIQADESVEDALFRELREEVGLTRQAVQVLARTHGWLRYRFPSELQRHANSQFLGQKQKWFLLRLLVDDSTVCVTQEAKPEFDRWRWVAYWYPLGAVVAFKRDVYRRALAELAPAVRLDS